MKIMKKMQCRCQNENAQKMHVSTKKEVECANIHKVIFFR